MPYAYSASSLPTGADPLDAPASASKRARGWRLWPAVSVGVLLLIGAGAWGGSVVAADTSPFTAGVLAGNYFPGSFEAVRLDTGDLFFAHILSHNGLVELTDVYFVDPASGRLVQGKPGAAPEPGVPAGAASGLFGPGTPFVVNPAQIVTVSPVTDSSPVGRQIAATEAREARRRAESTTTAKPLGFQ